MAGLRDCPICGTPFVTPDTGPRERERLAAAGYAASGGSRYRDEPVCVHCSQRETLAMFEFRDQVLGEDEAGV
ncbi:MAG: hypothetical protein ACO3PB_03585 [Miltoncostaeaceae bacterium]|jgi:hypothetical protein